MVDYVQGLKVGICSDARYVNRHHTINMRSQIDIVAYQFLRLRVCSRKLRLCMYVINCYFACNAWIPMSSFIGR